MSEADEVRFLIANLDRSIERRAQLQALQVKARDELAARLARLESKVA